MILNVKSIADFSRCVLFRALFPMAALCASLSGCGQAGPLYLPKPPAPVAKPAATPAAQAPAPAAPASGASSSAPASK